MEKRGVNFMACKLYLNKKICKKGEEEKEEEKRRQHSDRRAKEGALAGKLLSLSSTHAHPSVPCFVMLGLDSVNHLPLLLVGA